MVWTKEQKRAARLAASPAFPRPRGLTPFGCTWNMNELLVMLLVPHTPVGTRH